MREAALDQHGIVAQLVRNLVAHDGYCRADAHADRLRETRTHSHAVLWTVQKRKKRNTKIIYKQVFWSRNEQKRSDQKISKSIKERLMKPKLT